MSTIRIKKSELQDPGNALKFVRIVGRERYREALQAISYQHFGGGKLDKMAAQLSKVSDKNYPAYQKKLEEEMVKLRPVAEDVEIDFEILPSDLEFHKQEMFLDLLGEKRFFQANDLEGMEDANSKALQKANPYLAEKEKARQAEIQRQMEMRERREEEEKQILKDAGIDPDEKGKSKDRR